MIWESVASLFSVWEIEIISAIGEMTRISAGMTRPVMPRKVRIVWPWLVIRSMPRNAWVIQITPVRLTRTTANDASVVRKIYLSIDPITPALPPRSRTHSRNPPEFSGSPIVTPRTAGLAYSLTSILLIRQQKGWGMAPPFHRVNKSFDVARLPLWRLAGPRRAGHSVEYAPGGFIVRCRRRHLWPLPAGFA